MPDNPDKTRAARDRLLEVGLRSFARQGYEHAAVNEMAREARVTTGSIYAHFRDKEDFFLAVADRLVEDLIFELRQLPTDFEDFETAVAYLAAHYRPFVDEWSEWPLMLAELLRYRTAKRIRRMTPTTSWDAVCWRLSWLPRSIDSRAACGGLSAGRHQRSSGRPGSPCTRSRSSACVIHRRCPTTSSTT
jgi:AcrR family transcriptional regulator